MKKKQILNVVVTGGCGFIGSKLINSLLARKGFKLRAFDNFSVGNIQNLGYRSVGLSPISAVKPSDWTNELEVFEGDVTNAQELTNVLEGADCVVHLAANTGVQPSISDPIADATVNILGTLNVLEACRMNGLRRFVFASSGAPLGDQIPPLHEEMAPRPASPYGASKMSGEGYCSAYYHAFGIETVALRFGNVYGPGSFVKESVIAKFIRNILSGEDIIIYGNGSQTRDFVYIDDLTDAIYSSIVASNIGGEIFQIATRTETTVSEIAQVIFAEFKKRGIYSRSKIKYRELPKGDVKRNYSNTDKAKRILNWSAQFDIDSGVAKTIEYFLFDVLEK
ncbi:GDP-mannose 4,6-dehydratase [Gammaproteobacteria bacterium]|nr:GDP-mannose 4,6-dehydratase [Gammaproteobacteria bacterium]